MKTTQEQWNRRKVITSGLGFVGMTTLAGQANADLFDWFTGGGLDEEPDVVSGNTTLEQYRGYSNGYELGNGKGDPIKYEHLMNTEGWTVEVDGKVLSLDEIRGKPFEDLQSEWFNFRCVERWGMHVNYNGFPLSEILEEFGDTSKKYVAFECVQQEGLPGQNRRGFPWPYVEALEMQEAMHSLTWAVFGNYGTPSVANGAPFRVNVPWKYGYKGPKWVTKIICTDEKPPATWNMIAPNEYSWHSNVYPDISHPRWSQKKHRLIVESGTINVDTLRYNGYEDQVAHMYPNDDYEY